MVILAQSVIFLNEVTQHLLTHENSFYTIAFQNDVIASGLVHV